MGIAAFLYGAFSYIVFLASFLYAIGFVGSAIVPKKRSTRISLRTSKQTHS
jgi:hypothetical protein